MQLESAAPKVKLVKVFSSPYDNAVATARTCYSSRIITDDDVREKPELRDRIAASIYKAGHHTTLQHAHFQFALENVSRQSLWSFFHAHTFYNSEQVSQRYVEVKPGRVLIPEFGRATHSQVYKRCVERQMATYKDLIELLTPAVTDTYFGIFPARRNRPGKGYERPIKKKSQETARYVLPVATHAHLYHTISGITLHRYHRIAEMLDCPSEQKAIIDQMIQEVEREDPDFFRRAEAMMPLEDTHEVALLKKLGLENGVAPEDARNFTREFDRSLEGQTSVLVDHSQNPTKILADGLREAFGLLPAQLADVDAVRYLLDPKESPYLSEALNLNTLGKGMRALKLVHFTFRKKLSHTADSQAQRHRMTPGVRPALHLHMIPGEPDYILPVLFDHPLAVDAKARYVEEMERTWGDIKTLSDDGVAPEAWQYLLPNAVSVRFTETGSLSDQHHKWTTRLCFTAQEEIWKSCLDEVKQVNEVTPEIGQWLLPPCGLRDRAEQGPRCPEGDRFCGVKVWRQDRSEYLRVL